MHSGSIRIGYGYIYIYIYIYILIPRCLWVDRTGNYTTKCLLQPTAWITLHKALAQHTRHARTHARMHAFKHNTPGEINVLIKHSSSRKKNFCSPVFHILLCMHSSLHNSQFFNCNSKKIPKVCCFACHLFQTPVVTLVGEHFALLQLCVCWFHLLIFVFEIKIW